MELQGKTVMVLGGAGLVGHAICRELQGEGVKRLIVCSLKKDEAEESIERLRRLFPNATCEFQAEGGDIFAPLDLKDMPKGERLEDPAHRARLTDLLLNPISDAIIEQATLYQWCTQYKPDIILDCVNSATALAYADVYSSANELRAKCQDEHAKNVSIEDVERLYLSMGVPQLIRHIQILWWSMHRAKTGFYLKIGTSGTGGLGINMPYTHSEGKAAQLLLSKAALAGAHTLLLFLLARTPDGPIVKELKPAAYIGWKKIGFGPILHRGQPLILEDCPLDAATDVGPASVAALGTFPPKQITDDAGKPRPLEAPYIDTGENGMWAHHEFALVTDQSQMEFITPEEIGQIAVSEIKGRNTGNDIVASLDNSCLGPTYRAGYMRKTALAKLRQLEEESGIESISFEMPGPAAAKLLYEAHLLKQCYASCEDVAKTSAEDIAKRTHALIAENADLRARILTVGLPIFLPNGTQLLRGSEMHIPSSNQRMTSPNPTQDDFDLWASEGWVDLRVTNWNQWRRRCKDIVQHLQTIDPDDTSSFNAQGSRYWEIDADGNHPILRSKLVSWIFRTEEHGERMKD